MVGLERPSPFDSVVPQSFGSTVQHEQYPAAPAVSITTPPYDAFGPAVDAHRIRPCNLGPGAIFGIDVGDLPRDAHALRSILLHTRQRFPAVPVVLRVRRTLDLESVQVIQVAAQLHVRGVIADDVPVRETLRRVLTNPVDLPADVVEWFSLRLTILPPQVAELIRKIFEYACTRVAVQRLLGDLGESTRTARARCRKLSLPPPGSWAQAARAVHAALCLQRAQSTPLLELAMELGYSDHSALSHQLTRVFGANAGTIRNTLGWEWLLDAWLARWPQRAALA